MFLRSWTLTMSSRRKELCTEGIHRMIVLKVAIVPMVTDDPNSVCSLPFFFSLSSPSPFADWVCLYREKDNTAFTHTKKSGSPAAEMRSHRKKKEQRNTTRRRKLSSFSLVLGYFLLSLFFSRNAVRLHAARSAHCRIRGGESLLAEQIETQRLGLMRTNTYTRSFYYRFKPDPQRYCESRQQCEWFVWKQTQRESSAPANFNQQLREREREREEPLV